MIEKRNVLVVDIDGTICSVRTPTQSYSDVAPEPRMVARLKEFERDGWTIILYTARGMNTHEGNVGRINANIFPTLIEWLERHEIPYHELHCGKPWAAANGFYIDDRSVRPREFIENSLGELDKICSRDRLA